MANRDLKISFITDKNRELSLAMKTQPILALQSWFLGGTPNGMFGTATQKTTQSGASHTLLTWEEKKDWSPNLPVKCIRSGHIPSKIEQDLGIPPNSLKRQTQYQETN